MKVMIVDDQTLVRKGVRLLLQRIPSLQIVAEATNGEDALPMVQKLAPDLVCMDLAMPGMGGLEAALRLLRLMPTLKILVLTAFRTPLFSLLLFQAGIAGYLTKDASFEEMQQAIETIRNGQRYVDLTIAAALALSRLKQEEQMPFYRLSTREVQILFLLLHGCLVKEIAYLLHLSAKTVNTYRYTMFKKLAVKSNIELVRLAMQHGLVLNKGMSDSMIRGRS